MTWPEGHNLLVPSVYSYLTDDIFTSQIVLTICYWPYFIYELVTFIATIGDLDRVANAYLLISHFSTTFKFLNIIVNYKNVASILDQINSKAKFHEIESNKN